MREYNNKITLLSRLRVVVILFAVAFAIAIMPFANLSATAAGFNASNIIDDVIFYDSNTMSTDQIQTFLNSKTPSCDTNGTQNVTYYYNSITGAVSLSSNKYVQGVSTTTTRAVYGKRYNTYTGRDDGGAPFICLQDYRQTTTTRAADSYCKSYDGATNQTSAEIIHNVAQSCGINPKVLIVLLQKEQALVTDAWPQGLQYQSATGMGCPDTSACNEKYYGFFNQIYNAARQFKLYRAFPNDYNYVAGRNNIIQWSPDISCGSSTVYIQNQATAGLYNYTPYRPNQLALNAEYGLGDGCSSYGNRNFFLYYSDWFGPTHAYVGLDSPRWMTISHDLQKVDPVSGNAVGNLLTVGTQLYFTDKLNMNGEWYLRTEYDSQNGADKVIKLSDINEINYEPLSEPRYMVLNRSVKKINPVTQKTISQDFPNSTYALFTSKILVNNRWYYRTSFDANTNNYSSFPADAVSDISFQPLDKPGFMTARQGTTFTNLRTGQTSSTTISMNDFFLTDRVQLNSEWYYRAKTDSDSNNIIAANSNNFQEINFTTLATPYSIKVINDSAKFNPLTSELISDHTIKKDQIIDVSRIISVDRQQYYQTRWDYENGLSYGIRTSDTLPYRLNFIPLDNPRSIGFKQSANKVDLLTNQSTNIAIDQNVNIKFTTKTQIGYTWFLRTQYDTNLSLPYGIEARYLGL